MNRYCLILVAATIELAFMTNSHAALIVSGWNDPSSSLPQSSGTSAAQESSNVPADPVPTQEKRPELTEVGLAGGSGLTGGASGAGGNPLEFPADVTDDDPASPLTELTEWIVEASLMHSNPYLAGDTPPPRP